MSKTLVVEVGKRGTLRLPSEIAAELPEGTKLAVKRGRNGRMTLTPVREESPAQAWTPEEIAEWNELVADLQRRAKERGLTTQKKILTEIKRVRERLYGTTNRS